MVTANEKSIIDIHMKKKEESKPQERKEKRKGRRKTYKNKSKTINEMAIRTYISMITLNVNRLNALTKRHRLA